MIRRPSGDEFWLITQQAHADVAARFASHFGNDPDGLYAPPAEHERFTRAVALHDAGWREHDDRPALNADGWPLDVFDDRPFEQTAEIVLRSVERAAVVDPYAGLLVSLHFGRFPLPPVTEDNRFAILEYQQDQAEWQERLREQCGLSTEITTNGGLAVDSDDPAEVRLRADFQRLRACDMLSLCACRATPPADRLGPLPRRDGGPSLPASVSRENWNASAPTAGDLVVHPWPFSIDSFELRVPYRLVPQRRYADEADLARTANEAQPGELQVTIRPQPRRNATLV